MSDRVLLDRLSALRSELAVRGVNAMLVPRADAHQNEYVAPCDERLKFISGFTGSAGVVAVTATEAALFTDGRYTIQAEAQLPTAGWQRRHLAKEPLADWLLGALSPGSSVGFDPRLHRASEIQNLETQLQRQDVRLVRLDPNPIDVIWVDRPAPPMGKAERFPEDFAGEPVTEKLNRLAAQLREEGCDGLLISAPDSLAWLLNIRGSDLDMLPITFGYGVVTADGHATVYIASAKLDPPVQEAFAATGRITVAAPEALAFDAFVGRKIRCDAATASIYLTELAEAQGARVDLGKDPIQAMKAVKNATEIAGTREAHLRDGAAVTRFLRWFAEDRPKDATEWDASEALEGYRGALNQYRGPSFPTISATGESAAQAHYRADADSAKAIGTNTVYLSDSGGQYLDGTTDVTRVTVAGTPTDEMRMRYTQVLRGHIALLRQRFPKGVDGAQLDSLARQFLWQEGVDFDHGTGHGIGHYLSVHEGPQSISVRGRGVALEPGMIVSIEPGYYKAGAFGIRIENLAVVQPVADPPALADRPLLEFEVLTYVPYERSLIDLNLLSVEDIAWVDAYHAKVWDVLSLRLDGADLAYLERMTAPLQ